jgi:hypothetical protein
MAKADAEIKVDADASGVERAMASAKSAVREFASAFTDSIGSAAREVTSSLANVALAAGKVNFASQHAQVREFEASSAHLAVAMGRDLETVRGSIESTGLAIGKRPQEVAQWTESVGRLTYNFDSAGKSIKGMAGLAAETGRSVQDYQGLAVTLANVGKVTGDTTHAIGVMQAQADKFGTIGGVAAFADQIEGLSDTMSHFAISGEQDLAKITAAAAELGKGISPAAAQRVQQTAFGSVQANPMEWSRFLGKDITDEHGQVKDAAGVLQQITEKIKRTYGKDARRMLQYQFGAETGAQLYNADFGKVAEGANLAASGKPEAALKTYQGTDTGKREAADAQLAVSSRELLGASTKLGMASDAMQRWASTNPITATLVSSALGSGASSFMTNFGSSFSKIMGPGGVGAGLSTGAKAIPIVGAAVAGAALGWEAAGGQAEIDRSYQEAVHTRTPEDEQRARHLLIQREIRDRVRAAKGFKPAGTGAFIPPAEDTQLALQAGQSKEGQAALYGQLRKENVSEQDALTIARAVAEAMKNVKIEVTQAPDTPTAITAKTSHSTAAGHQGHGG